MSRFVMVSAVIRCLVVGPFISETIDGTPDCRLVASWTFVGATEMTERDVSEM